MTPDDGIAFGPAQAITAVGIVTRGREASLGTCVDSYRQNCRRHDRTPRFVITDDSRGDDAQARTRSTLRLQQRDDTPISYGGHHERLRFVEALAEDSGIPIDVIRFGVLGDERCSITTGANRNSLLLETLDTLVLSVDDDTRCRVGAPPGAEASVVPFTGYDPTEFWFFADHRAAIESLLFSDVDILGCHETMLGRRRVQDGAHVAITLQGLAGDSGMGTPHYYLGLAGASRARLVETLDGYRSAFRSREVVRVVRRPTCAASPFCMTTCFGYDNRVPLPPFFPVQRNSDGIFGLMLQRCVGGTRTGFLPSVIVHQPEPPRSCLADDIWAETATVRTADLVIGCVLAHNPGNALLDANARFVQLGRFLQELSALTLPAFEARVRGYQQFRVMAFVALLQSRLQMHDASPSYWAADVQRVIDLFSEAAGTDDYVIPRDLREGRGRDEARQFSQELIGRFGELVEAWPTIVAAARRLLAQGRRLTTPV